MSTLPCETIRPDFFDLVNGFLCSGNFEMFYEDSCKQQCKDVTTEKTADATVLDFVGLNFHTCPVKSLSRVV